MPIKSILVPLNGVASDRSTLDLAFAVARGSCAHVDALFVTRDPTEALAYAGLGADTAVLQQIADKIAHDADRASAEARRGWVAWCADNGLAEAARPVKSDRVTAALQERRGAMRDRIVEAAAAADLIVLTSAMDQTLVLPELAIEAALFETGRPVLMAPLAAATLPVDTAVIAWNGSLEANRAVAAAVPLLQSCKQLFVFCQGERRHPAANPAALLDYFGWHGFKAERLCVYQQHGTVGENLLAGVTHVRAGLLVMGAYTHSRLRQMVLGGVTSHVMHHAALPVLLAH